LVKPVFRVLAYFLFFGWNLWFLAFLGLGVTPAILVEMAVAVWAGMVPASFAVYGGLLVATPALGLIAALHPKLRTEPGRLLSMFYGIQAPVMLLCAVRLFAIHQVSAPIALSLALVGVGSASLARTLVKGPTEGSSAAQVARHVAQSGYLLAGLWWAALVALYAAPCTQLVLQGAWNAGWELIANPEWFSPQAATTIGMVAGMLGFTGLVLAGFPVAMLGISASAFRVVARATAERVGWPLTWALTSATAAGWVVAIGLTGRQPQDAAFDALDAAKDDAGRRAALLQSDRVREGLLFADLAWARTFDADPHGTHVADLWKPLVGETLAEGPRLAWVGLTWPFVYHPHSDLEDTWQESEATRAAAAYADFFDAPIEVAERQALVAASQATWNWEDARAGLLEVGQQKVHLDRQEVTVEPRGDVAEVTVHDVYRNRTWDRQEVLVSFSLPESAAVTGLWLGADPDRSKAFAYVVAPRGAAQQVYEEQVRERRDPALLEQVGPREYRLRAFPVLPREGRPDDVTSITAEGPPLHLWLTVTVPIVQEEDGIGFFPLPRAAEGRNLFWDADTARVGEAPGDEWLPGRVDAPNTAKRSHDAVIGGWQVHAEPAGAVPPTRLRRIEVLVDDTRSMEGHRDEVDAALARLTGAADQVDVLCVRERNLAPCPGFQASDALFWGSTALETRLVQAAPFARGADALVVLTDAGSYPLAAKAEAEGLPDAELPPLWLVHLGGPPTAYPDWTLDRMQRTGGGAAASVDEVLVRIADPSVRDGWHWAFAPAEGPDTPADAFRPLAARALVAHLDQLHRSGALSTLDELHGVAVREHVVTAYSSMLVLVDEDQLKRLADLEQGDDRFQREVIDQPAPQVSSAPEPAALVLLGLGSAGVLLAGRRKRAA
jgi:putative PEP-CTERM system integral membrane protein